MIKEYDANEMHTFKSIYGVSSKETEPQSNQTYMLDPLVYCEGICKRFKHLI